MPVPTLLASLLQIPLSEQIQKRLTTVQEAPLVATVITVCVVLGLILVFLEMQSNRLSSLLGNLLNIRSQLDDLGKAPTAANEGLVGCPVDAPQDH